MLLNCNTSHIVDWAHFPPKHRFCQSKTKSRLFFLAHYEVTVNIVLLIHPSSQATCFVSIQLPHLWK